MNLILNNRIAGQKDVETTMIYSHVFNRGGTDIRSPRLKSFWQGRFTQNRIRQRAVVQDATSAMNKQIDGMTSLISKRNEAANIASRFYSDQGTHSSPDGGQLWGQERREYAPCAPRKKLDMDEVRSKHFMLQRRKATSSKTNKERFHERIKSTERHLV